MSASGSVIRKNRNLPSLKQQADKKKLRADREKRKNCVIYGANSRSGQTTFFKRESMRARLGNQFKQMGGGTVGFIPPTEPVFPSYTERGRRLAEVTTATSLLSRQNSFSFGRAFVHVLHSTSYVSSVLLIERFILALCPLYYII